MPSVNYTADTTTNFTNPERGMTYGVDTSGSEASDANFFSAQAATYGRSFYRVIFAINAYSATATIAGSKITELENFLLRMRSAGVKGILRPWYGSSGSTDDASHSIVTAHITQLAPYLSSYADVIPIYEAGYIGSWGEWAFSENYGSTDGTTYTAGLTTTQWSDRTGVITNMLSACPADTFVAIRCPYFKMHMFGTNAITAGEKFTQTQRARVSHFNDAFVSGNDDFNTYIDTAVDKPYLAQETQWLPFGGESAAFDATYGTCTPAQNELSRMHASYLNFSYHPDVINNWSANGCLSAIQMNLGYRFNLISSTYASTATIGQACNVNIHINNAGYAAPFGRRTTYYVLRNATHSYAYALATDCRNWQHGSISVAETISLTSTMVAGTYNAYLWMPDRAAVLSNRPAYSIRFANQNVWDTTEGFNNLNQSIAVVAADVGGGTDVPRPRLGRSLRRIFG